MQLSGWESYGLRSSLEPRDLEINHGDPKSKVSKCKCELRHTHVHSPLFGHLLYIETAAAVSSSAAALHDGR